MFGLKCPLCSDKMDYKEVKNFDKYNPNFPEKQSTHVWVCKNSCPCVVFEFWNNEDIDNLKKVLK